MENHAKYPDTIYFQSDAALWVNLFVASALTWRERGLTVRQETRFPDEDTTRLTFTAEQPTRLTLKLRYPSWARDGASLRVNGQAVAVDATPGSYISIVSRVAHRRRPDGAVPDAPAHRAAARQPEDDRDLLRADPARRRPRHHGSVG